MGKNETNQDTLAASGRNPKKITDLQWHILATAYVHLIFEIVRHDMAKEEAMQHMRFVSTLLYPGWKEIFGLGMILLLLIIQDAVAWHVIPIIVIAVMAEAVRANFKYNWMGHVIYVVKDLDSVGINGTYMKNLRRVDTKGRDLRYKCLPMTTTCRF